MSTKIPMFNERHCPVCGKEFYPNPSWAYKERDDHGRPTYYCSWKCFNHRNDKKKGNYHYKPIEQLTYDEELVHTYENAYEAATAMDGNLTSIRDACRLQKKYKGYLWRYKNDGLPEV